MEEKTRIILELMEKLVRSAAYRKLIDKQNSRWKKHLFPKEESLLPAAGINYEELTRAILESISKKFGEELSLTVTSKWEAKKSIREALFPQPMIADANGTPLGDYKRSDVPPITGTHSTSYLPDDIDEEILGWLGTTRTIRDFFEEANRKYSIFPGKGDSENTETYIMLDIFFTALERKMNSQGTFLEAKGLRKYQDSPYIPPEFLRHEMSAMLPFYTYKETGTGTKSTLEVEPAERLFANQAERKAWGTPFVNDTPLDFLQKTFSSDDDISDCLTENVEKKGAKPFLILKCVYPLYLFLYNNIVSFIAWHEPRTDNYTKGQTISRTIKLREDFGEYKRGDILPGGTKIPKNYSHKSDSAPFKAVGCKPTNPPKENLASIMDFLNPFASFKINPLQKSAKIPERRKYFIAPQLYALKNFRDYLDELEAMQRSKGYTCDFKVSYSYVEGNSHERTHKNLKVKCNRLFTLWMFIRHSELFHIALMPKVAEIFQDVYQKEDDKRKGLFVMPKNFLTAFHFNSNVFAYYPNFHKEYNRFVDLSAKPILKKLAKMSLQECLEITSAIEKKLSRPGRGSKYSERFIGLDRFSGILLDFYEAIKMKSPTDYDENIFNVYFNMATNIKSNEAKKQGKSGTRE